MSNRKILSKYYSMISFKNLPVPYRKLSVRAVGGLAISVLAAAAGVLLVGVSGWFITATAITGLGMLSMQSYNLFLPSAVIRMLALVKPPLKYYERLYHHQLTFRLAGKTRSWLLRRIFKSNKEELVKFRDIGFTTKITVDVNQMDQLLTGLLIPWLVNLAIFLIAVVYFMQTVPVLAIFISCIYLLCGLIIPLAALKRGLQRGEEYRLQQQLEAHLSDQIYGFKELLSFGMFNHYSQLSRSLIAKISFSKRMALNTKNEYSFLQTLVLETALLIVLVIVCLTEKLPDGPLMVLSVLVVLSLFESVSPLAGLFYEQADTFRSAQSLNDIVKVRDGKTIVSGNYLSAADSSSAAGITISNLNFAYKKRILYHDLNMDLPAGTTTVIKGKNGAGKSTLLDLIFGFLVPVSGEILVNGKGAADQSLMTDMSYLEQHPALFNISILENIRLAKPDATSGEVNDAAVTAGLKSHLDGFPEGLNQLVEEGGLNLSGGQKRMICLARVILKDTAIVLLDEPTEGMDSRAEQRFVELINGWHGQKTIVLISHKKIPGLAADRLHEMTNPE